MEEDAGRRCDAMEERFSGSRVYDVLCAAGDEEINCTLSVTSNFSPKRTDYVFYEFMA